MLKKILLFILIALSPTYIQALGEEIHNLKYERSYYTAKKKALAEDKALLIMMSIKGCPNCNYMKDIVFERENILEYLNKNFVVLIFDINRDRHIYPKRFRALHGPTFFFLDPKDEHELREKKVGGWMPFKFIEVLQEVRAAYDGIELNTTTKKSESNITTSSLIRLQ